MKKAVLIGLFGAIGLTGCGVLPIEPTVKENHFRIENEKQTFEDGPVYTYLMCHNNKPVIWDTAKQYEAGDHTLWVKSVKFTRGAKNSLREASAKFDVNLEQGKTYELQSNLRGSEVDMWIAERESGNRVTELVTRKMQYPVHQNDLQDRHQCVEGTI